MTMKRVHCRPPPTDHREECPLSTMAILVRRAAHEELPLILELQNLAYGARGYWEDPLAPRDSLYPEFEYTVYPYSLTYVALYENQVVGTLSLTLDGECFCGSPLDQEFPVEAKRARKEAHKIIYFWRLAVHPDFQASKLRIREWLLREARNFVIADPKIGRALCIVHPNHVAFYVNVFGFQEVARKDSTKGLTKAPAVLLSLDADRVRRAEAQARHRSATTQTMP